MKLALNIIGGLLILAGTLWILQGLDVLPGSFMTGQIKWAMYGAVLLTAGCVMLYAARKRRPPPVSTKFKP